MSKFDLSMSNVVLKMDQGMVRGCDGGENILQLAYIRPEEVICLEALSFFVSFLFHIQILEINAIICSLK